MLEVSTLEGMNAKDLVLLHLGKILGRLLTLEAALLERGLLSMDDLLDAEREAVDNPDFTDALMLVSHSLSEAREFLSQRLNESDPDESVLFRQARDAGA